MLGRAMALVLGIVLRLAWPALWPGWVAGSLLAGACLLACRARWRLPAMLLLGLAMAEFAVQRETAQRLAEPLRQVVVAEVIDLPAHDGRGVQFTALVRPRDHPEDPVRRVRLRFDGQQGHTVQAGETWQLILRLQPLWPALNPAGIDAARNALRDRLHARGSVIASRLNQRLAPAPPSVLRLRANLAAAIDRQVRDPDAAALVAALAIGATQQVRREQWQVFNATGITHLVAISGMHVTLFAVLAMAAARRLWRPLARAGLGMARERFAAVAGLLLATAYALLAGFSIPTQRTLLMLSGWLLLKAAGRELRPSTAFALALVAISLHDPLAVLSAGYWLSFLAVGVIIGIAGGRWQPLQGWRAAADVQWIVFVALLPVTLAVFGSVSLAGLWVNIAAIPYFSFLLVPVALLATAVQGLWPVAWGAGVPAAPWWLAGQLAEWAGPWLSLAAGSPAALWHRQPDAWWFLLALPALALALLPWPWRWRCLGGLALLPLCAPPARLPAGTLEVTVLDVGKGHALLLRTRDQRWLYGTGDHFGSGGAAVEYAVLPLLRRWRAASLDAVVLPRLDYDSGDGVAVLESDVAVRERWAQPGRGRELAPGFRACPPADRTEHAAPREGWRVQVLALGDGCALQVQGHGHGLLLAAQLDGRTARQLAEARAGPFDVVLAPRFLARTGASAAELAALGARWAVTSLPSATPPSQLQQTAWRDAGIRLLTTAGAGALTLRAVGPGPWQWQGERMRAWGVWQALGAVSSGACGNCSSPAAP